MKILLAADGSRYTSTAVDYLSKHLDWFNGSPELHLLTVKLPIPSGLAAGRARSLLGNDAVDNYYKEEAEGQLQPAKAILDAAKIPYQAHFVVGDPAEEICAFAQKNQIDLIVVGSHGHGGLVTMVMGSVATAVVAHSHVPVLIVR